MQKNFVSDVISNLMCKESLKLFVRMDAAIGSECFFILTDFPNTDSELLESQFFRTDKNSNRGLN